MWKKKIKDHKAWKANVEIYEKAAETVINGIHPINAKTERLPKHIHTHTHSKDTHVKLY